MALDVNQIRNITSMCYPNIDHTVTDDDITFHIRFILDPSVVTIPMWIDESALNGCFSRKKLKHLSTWHLWKASETLQLHKMATQEMFG